MIIPIRRSICEFVRNEGMLGPLPPSVAYGLALACALHRNFRTSRAMREPSSSTIPLLNK